jgi:hypothetical protein
MGFIIYWQVLHVGHWTERAFQEMEGILIGNGVSNGVLLLLLLFYKRRKPYSKWVSVSFFYCRSDQVVRPPLRPYDLVFEKTPEATRDDIFSLASDEKTANTRQ